MEEIENLGLTSPWYPDRESMVTEHSMNSVRYLRTVHPSRKKNSKISHKLVHFFTRKPVLDKANTTKSVKKKIILLRIFDFFYYGVFKVGRAIRHFFRIGWKVIEEKILIKFSPNFLHCSHVFLFKCSQLSSNYLSTNHLFGQWPIRQLCLSLCSGQLSCRKLFF